MRYIKCFTRNDDESRIPLEQIRTLALFMRTKVYCLYEISCYSIGSPLNNEGSQPSDLRACILRLYTFGTFEKRARVPPPKSRIYFKARNSNGLDRVRGIIKLAFSFERGK